MQNVFKYNFGGLAVAIKYFEVNKMVIIYLRILLLESVKIYWLDLHTNTLRSKTIHIVNTNE